MTKPKGYDFGGYATRYNIQCSDGRTIKPEAFKHAHGQKVPLVYHHIHDDVSNVLGHAILEHRMDGLYAYCYFNNLEKAQMSKEIVQHGDVTSLSIWANGLKQRASEVLHGIIREVSLVLSGANPEAKIDNVSFKHGDSFEESADDVIITAGMPIDLEHSGVDEDPEKNKEEVSEDDKKVEEEIEHEDKKEETMADAERTVKDVYDEFTDEQKAVVDALVGAAVEAAENGDLDEDESMEQDGFGGTMNNNVFDQAGTANREAALAHDALNAVFDDMQAGSSLKEAFIAHGITNVEVLFPEARAAAMTPETIQRDQEWVSDFLGAAKKSPFSRVKSTWMDITEDQARAKGYIKGRQKLEEIIVAGKRKTEPQTIYKLQKMDRDDIIDVVDFDVVAYLHAEMRLMINEEVARAALIGDGRSDAAEDKINPLNVRPIWQDDPLYTTNDVLDPVVDETPDARAQRFIDEVVRARKNYKGSGTPTCYIGTDLLTDCLLAKDGLGYRLYKTEAELAAAMRVSKIVEVELFDAQTRVVGADTFQLAAIVVNPRDYTIGADKGGELTSFEDFDLNFNKHEYLIETRISGALVKPKSALSFEFKK